jgi:hypothetical protein
VLASNLFLVLRVFGLGLLALLPDTDIAGMRALVTEHPVGILSGLVVANGTLLELDDVLDGQGKGGAADDVLGSLGGLDVLSRSVTLLGLAVATGEDNEALPELLETLHVELESLLGEVLAARIDRDSDCARHLTGDTGSCGDVSGRSGCVRWVD